MAEREIKIGFPEVKMEALEFFLKENDTTVEKVLREHLDKTYEKSVAPAGQKICGKQDDSPDGRACPE